MALLVTLGVAALTLTGCTSDGSPTSPGPDSTTRISAQQVSALSDAHITWDEYSEAYVAYRDCLSKAGHALIDPRVEDDLYDASIPGAAVEDGSNTRCYSYYWDRVDSVWQIAHEDTSYSARFVINCLETRGVPHQRRYQDNLKLLTAHGLKLADCPAYTDAN